MEAIGWTGAGQETGDWWRCELSLCIYFYSRCRQQRRACCSLSLLVCRCWPLQSGSCASCISPHFDFFFQSLHLPLSGLILKASLLTGLSLSRHSVPDASWHEVSVHTLSTQREVLNKGFGTCHILKELCDDTEATPTASQSEEKKNPFQSLTQQYVTPYAINPNFTPLIMALKLFRQIKWST